MAVATIEAVRDRVYALLESLTPTTLSRDKFRRYRNEEGARFDDWAEKNPAAAFRRFQVREVGDDEAPTVSDLTNEDQFFTLQILIAYPQNARTGRDNAMDRDDVIRQDLKLIRNAIGWSARGNFSGASDCTPLGAEKKSTESAGSVDIVVIHARFRTWLSTS